MLPWVSLWAFTLPIQMAGQFAPADSSWVRHTGETIAKYKGAEDAIPPEQYLDILKAKVKELDRNKAKFFDRLASQAVEVDRLTREVANATGADLQAKKDLLDARKKALEDGKAQLAALESKKQELAAQLEKVEVELKELRQREGQGGLKASDDDLTKLKAQMDDIEKKIEERQKALDLQKEFDKAQPADGPKDK